MEAVHEFNAEEIMPSSIIELADQQNKAAEEFKAAAEEEKKEDQ
jgi:hypothetical protein